MKLKITLCLILAVIVFGCSDTETKEKLEALKLELQKTKSDLSICSSQLTEIQNTPEQREIRARKYIAEGNLEKAKLEYQGIVSNFKGTEEAKLAEKEVLAIEKKIAAKIAEEERKKALGYKVLSPTSKVEYGDLSLRFDRIWTGKRWSFDDHGREYFLRDAKRGNSHVLARVSITSENHNPTLPPVSVYKMENGELKLLGTLGYEFRRWEDYGSYLGNTADYGNDFAHSKTIPFNLGLELPNEQLEGSIFVVLKKSGCFIREAKPFGRPEVQYSKGTCNVKTILTVEDFDNEYVLLKKM